MTKIRTIVLTIAALVIGIGAAFFMAQSSDDSGTQSSDGQSSQDATAPALGEVEADEQSLNDEIASNAEQTVTFTDSGFQPEALQVTTGTTVTFENNSSRDMWVASDPHPSHTDLPDFDTLRGYAPGEAYSYTFDEPGEWGYHDHLRSFDAGIVIVE